MTEYERMPAVPPHVPRLEESLGIDALDAGFEREVLSAIHSQAAWKPIGFLGAWEIQSQLSAVVLVALTAVVPTLLAFLPMLAWSVVATVVYYYARERGGVPDLLEVDRSRLVQPTRNFVVFARDLGITAGKAWLAGFQSFIYARSCCRLLMNPARNARDRWLQRGVVAFGLILFGVSTSQHVLRRAGFRGGQLLRLGLLGSLLNVGYRVLLSALLIDLATTLAGIPRL